MTMKKLLFALLMIPGFLQAQLIDVNGITMPAGNSPTLTTSVSSLPGMTTNAGSPSVALTFTLSGAALTGTVTVTAPTGFEVSKESSNWSGSLTYTPSGGNIPSQPVKVYVRITSSASGTPAGKVACTSSGAATRNVAVTGTVVSSAPTIILSTTTLAPYTYTTGNPSSAQTYTVSGANLTTDILVTPPSWLEVSPDGTNYGTTLSLTRSGGILAGQPVTVYQRGKGGNAPGAYSGNIAHTATGATEQDIAVNGTVNGSGSTTTKFNFTQTSKPVAGWTNVFGPVGTDVTTSDGATGWSLKVYGTRQGNFFGNLYATDDQGATTSTDPLFPPATVVGFYLNAAPPGIWNGSNYLCELTGMPAGSYTVTIFGSVKSTWNSQITTPEFHFKFGTNADQMVNSLNEQNNTTTSVSQTNTITAGQSILFSWNGNSGSNPAAGVGNAVIITKN